MSRLSLRSIPYLSRAKGRTPREFDAPTVYAVPPPDTNAKAAEETMFLSQYHCLL